MNKDETKRRLNCLEADCKNLGTEISILKNQLAEAEKLEELDKLLEKPKLGHGDFGVNKDNKDFVATEGYLPHRDIEPYYKNGHSDGCDYAKSNPGDYTIFGNVFDLMKGWSEPFEYWHSEKGRNYDTDTDLTIVIDTNDCRPDEIWIGTCGNSAWYPRKDAEEIHNELGHAIADLKRKENK